MRFDWDPAKDRANRATHGLGFDEAKMLFTSGVDYLEIYDVEHSSDEDRFLAIGLVSRGLICVVFSEHEDSVTRIIGARMATRREEKLFLDHRRRRRR